MTTRVLLLCTFWGASLAAAHDMRPAFLALDQLDSDTYEILWKVPARVANLEPGLAVRFDDRTESLGSPVRSFLNGSCVERWRVRRPGGLDGSSVTVDGLESVFNEVLVRAHHLDGTTQTALLKSGRPSLTIQAAPVGWAVPATYFRLGTEHILLGIDHLLFVLGLLLLVDRRWMLFKTITSFTVAHSLTLALSTFAVLRVPEAPLNAAIALSILFLGPEIARKWQGGSSTTIRRPWVVAFAFGLLHGIGFASGLSGTGIPQSDIPAALLFFNLGVECGQLAFVFLAICLANACRTLHLDRPRWVTRLPGYAVGSLGACWTLQRILPILGLL